MNTLKNMIIICDKNEPLQMHGISYGAAIDISTCCDIRLCTRDTIFSVREVAIGLAADLGTLSRLPKTGVSMSFIKDVALTARDWDAAEALQVGFVSGVYENKGKALERAMELARTIAEKSPVAVQGTKAVVNYSRDHSIEDGEFFFSFFFLLLQDVGGEEKHKLLKLLKLIIFFLNRSRLYRSLECGYASN